MCLACRDTFCELSCCEFGNLSDGEGVRELIEAMWKGGGMVCGREREGHTLSSAI